ncbi:MAG: hypothetical protein HW421_4029 [Ignavibacteria bacterium]|nr:hypothetical protein [Ignavibacteria bacterium]
MFTVNGIYENGTVQLEEPITVNKKFKLIVTFLDEEAPYPKKRLSKSDFSYNKAREKSKKYKGSFADAVVKERRSEL